MENTTLISATDYDVKNMIFKTPINRKMGPINYYRVPIKTKNEDGTIGDLLIEGPEFFSPGLFRNTDMNDETKTTGYSLSLCLSEMDGQNEDQKGFTDALDNIYDSCKEWLIENSEKVGRKGRDKIERADLRKMRPYQYQKDKVTKEEKLDAPVMFVKLIYNRKKGEIQTVMIDYDGNDVDPLSLEGKVYSKVKPILSVESIFLNSKTISVQVKLYNAYCHKLENKVKNFLKRPEPKNELEVEDENDEVKSPLGDDKEDDGEKIEDSDEEKPEPTPVPKTKIVKKRIVRKKRTVS